LRDKIPKLLRSCLAANPLTDFPIELFCDQLGAAAGTFWVQGEYDENEMVLSQWHNRPDLDDGHGRIAFPLNDSFMKDCIGPDQSPYIADSMKNFEQKGWASASLKNYAISNFKNGLFICLKPKRDKCSAIVSLYFYENMPNLDITDMTLLSVEIGTYIDTFTREMNLIMIERRKIGHEIARMLSLAESKLNRLKSVVYKNTAAIEPLADLKKALSSASEAASNETFIEGVINRKRYSRRLPLRRELVSAFHLAISKFGLSYNIIADNNIKPSLEIYISGDDLALLFSNIATNAVKYTIPGGGITTKISEFSGRSTLTISNMSKPLSKRDLERVWRFGLRGDNSEDVEGEGIGLTIVSDICSAYNIERSMSQRHSDNAVWTDVNLSFPSRMCIDRKQNEGGGRR
jgi:hypothetical protein